MLVLNLAPQAGETRGFTPEAHIEVLLAHAPGLKLDVVLADPATVTDREALQDVAASAGARLVLEPVAAPDGSARHDPGLLAAAYASIVGGGAAPWR